MSAPTISSQPSARLGHKHLYRVELKQAFSKFDLLKELHFDPSQIIRHLPSTDWIIHVLLTKEQAENLEKNAHVRSVSRIQRVVVPHSRVSGKDYESDLGALINETEQYPTPLPENLNYPSSGARFRSSSKGISETKKMGGEKKKQRPPGSELVIDEATGKASTPSDFGAGFLNLDVMNPNNVGLEHEKKNPNPITTRKRRSRKKKALEAEGE